MATKAQVDKLLTASGLDPETVKPSTRQKFEDNAEQIAAELKQQKEEDNA